MASYEARRLQNIEHNAALVRDLGLKSEFKSISRPHKGVEHDRDSEDGASDDGRTSTKRRKTTGTSSATRRSNVRKMKPEPTRASARIANAAARPSYNEDGDNGGSGAKSTRKQSSRPKQRSSGTAAATMKRSPSSEAITTVPVTDLATLQARWSSWTPIANREPTLDPETGDYHFADHPSFTPNKSPESILREGAFGGTYFRPLYSKKLRVTISDDWRELLPESWVRGLNVEKYLTSTDYDPEVNKYGVKCGQSIEEWEAAGWINHDVGDVRGWFQWYCRFWLGRRCEDDERQIARWKKCVGPQGGRWRRILLGRYVAAGIRSVMDEGMDDDDDDDGEGGEVGRGGGREGMDVSPVVHQTCHHWAWEVRQDALDRFWRDRK